MTGGGANHRLKDQNRGLENQPQTKWGQNNNWTTNRWIKRGGEPLATNLQNQYSDVETGAVKYEIRNFSGYLQDIRRMSGENPAVARRAPGKEDLWFASPNPLERREQSQETYRFRPQRQNHSGEMPEPLKVDIWRKVGEDKMELRTIGPLHKITK